MPTPSATAAAAAAKRQLALREISLMVVAIALIVLIVVVSLGAVVVLQVSPSMFQALPTTRAPLPLGASTNDACNPTCGTVAEICNEAKGTCELACSDISLPDGSVDFNKMCIAGYSGSVCVRGVPLGGGTAFILQSKLAAPHGGSLALTAVPGKPPKKAGGCAAPSFVLAPTDLLNKAQYFTAVNHTETMCSDPFQKTISKADCCEPGRCPCACCMDNVGGFKPGDYGSDPTPFACSAGVAATGIATCTSTGATVPCKNSYLVLATAADNPAGGGWTLQAAPTLAAGATPVPLCAMPTMPTTWREVPGSQAHISIAPQDCKFPAKGFTVVDSSFDRCEESRSVQLVNHGGVPAWGPLDCWSYTLEPPTAASSSPSNTWYVLPVKMQPQYWAQNACDAATAQTCPDLYQKGSLAPNGWGAYTPCSLKTIKGAKQAAGCAAPPP